MKNESVIRALIEDIKSDNQMFLTFLIGISRIASVKSIDMGAASLEIRQKLMHKGEPYTSSLNILTFREDESELNSRVNGIAATLINKYHKKSNNATIEMFTEAIMAGYHLKCIEQDEESEAEDQEEDPEDEFEIPVNIAIKEKEDD